MASSPTARCMRDRLGPTSAAASQRPAASSQQPAEQSPQNKVDSMLAPVCVRTAAAIFFVVAVRRWLRWLAVWSSGRLVVWMVPHTQSHNLSRSVWSGWRVGLEDPCTPGRCRDVRAKRGNFHALALFPRLGTRVDPPSIPCGSHPGCATSMADQFPAFFRIPEPGATNPDSALLSSLHQHTCSGPDAQRPDETVVLVLISRAASTSTKHIGWAKDWGFWPKCVGICDRLLRQVRVRHVMCHPAWPTID